MKTFKKVLLFTMLLIAIGCTRDGHENCPTIHLGFSYFADGDTEVIQNYIQSAQLFIYNEQGELVQRHQPDLLYLHRGRPMPLKLPCGKYKAVCWGNIDEYSRINDYRNLSTAHISVVGMEASSEIQTTDLLYKGVCEFEIGKELDFQNFQEIQMHAAHIKFDIQMKGLQQSLARIAVNQAASEYKFLEPLGTKLTTYNPLVVYTEEETGQRASLNVLRFDGHNSISIDVYTDDSNNKAASIDLTSFLSQYYSNLSLDLQEEITIKMLLEFSSLGVYATIPQWDKDHSNAGVE